MRRAVALVAAAAAALAAAGCGAEGVSGELTVFAAASLAEALPTVEPAATYQLGGSASLATQIREGAAADVYAAASPGHARALHEEGLVDEPRVFATNRLAVIVPADSELASVADLARPGVKLVLGAEGVPVGDYARSALSALGAAGALANVVSEEDDVKGIVAKVVLGEADAGIVYVTDVAPAGDGVRALELPAAAQPAIEYVVAVVSGSPRRDAANAFVARLLGPEGRAALEAAGFGVP